MIPITKAGMKVKDLPNILWQRIKQMWSLVSPACETSSFHQAPSPCLGQHIKCNLWGHPWRKNLCSGESFKREWEGKGDCCVWVMTEVELGVQKETRPEWAGLSTTPSHLWREGLGHPTFPSLTHREGFGIWTRGGRRRRRKERHL